MLAIIGFIAIFSAIIVFFSDELSAYMRALKAKPLLFLAFCLLLFSAVTVLCNHCFLWVTVTIWASLLMSIGWIVNEIAMSNGIIAIYFAKWLILCWICLSPILGVWLLIQWKKPFKKIGLVWQRQAYEAGIFLGAVALIFLGLQLS